jgi:hypothetical protein
MGLDLELKPTLFPENKCPLMYLQKLIKLRLWQLARLVYTKAELEDDFYRVGRHVALI